VGPSHSRLGTTTIVIATSRVVADKSFFFFDPSSGRGIVAVVKRLADAAGVRRSSSRCQAHWADVSRDQDEQQNSANVPHEALASSDALH